MKLLNKIILIICYCFFLNGCVTFKTAPKNEQRSGCNLVTKKLVLELTDKQSENMNEALNAIMRSLGDCAKPEFQPVAAAILAVPVGSFIVSGSVVVVGNSIYWLEQQGKCDDSETKKALNFFLDKMKHAGGKAINEVSDLVEWFNEYLKPNKL